MTCSTDLARALAAMGLTLDPRDQAAAERVFAYLQSCRQLLQADAPG